MNGFIGALLGTSFVASIMVDFDVVMVAIGVALNGQDVVIVVVVPTAAEIATVAGDG